MKLYYSPGACSMSPHITLRELGMKFELVRVDLREKKIPTGDYRAVNPKGYVPALELDNGELLTEGAVIVQYLADLKPETKLAPPAGTMERYRLQEWLNFIATELHKGMAPMYNPKSNDELKNTIRDRLTSRFAVLATQLEKQPFIMGKQLTVADPYAYYTMRSWRRHGQAELTGPLAAFFARMQDRPAVQAALQAEGLS